MSSVDPASQALDRLDEALAEHYRTGDYTTLGMAMQDNWPPVRQELQRLREELLFTARRPDDQEKIDAWWRARSEVKVDGNSRASSPTDGGGAK